MPKISSVELYNYMQTMSKKLSADVVGENPSYGAYNLEIKSVSIVSDWQLTFHISDSFIRISTLSRDDAIINEDGSIEINNYYFDRKIFIYESNHSGEDVIYSLERISFSEASITSGHALFTSNTSGSISNFTINVSDIPEARGGFGNRTISIDTQDCISTAAYRGLTRNL